MNRLVDWSKMVKHYLTSVHEKANAQERLDLHTLMYYLNLEECPIEGCGCKLYMESE